MDFITYRHSFNSGDLITVLPGIKHIWQQAGKKAVIFQRLNLPADYGHSDNHPVKNDGKQVCMNIQTFNMMKPLMECQEYIERFEIWNGQECDFDFDKTRQSSQMPLPGGDIHKWPTLIFPQLECDLVEGWITADQTKSDDIVINRTERYNNPYLSFFFLKPFENKISFVGTKQEHEKFCKDWGLNIYYEPVSDFRELADVINSSKLFIGNQSLCWHIADALQKPRLLEVCAQYPNTFPIGRNGKSFIAQESLEYFFHQNIKT